MLYYCCEPTLTWVIYPALAGKKHRARRPKQDPRSGGTGRCQVLIHMDTSDYSTSSTAYIRRSTRMVSDGLLSYRPSIWRSISALLHFRSLPPLPNLPGIVVQSRNVTRSVHCPLRSRRFFAMYTIILPLGCTASVKFPPVIKIKRALFQE